MLGSVLLVGCQNGPFPRFLTCDKGAPVPDLPEECSSCAGRCSGLTELSGKNFCSCDPACVAYGDCCPDIETQCPEEFQGGLRNLSANHWGSTCKGFMTTFSSTSYLLISVCLSSGIPCDVSVRPADVLESNLAVPITDVETGLHYVNGECARCNGVTKGEPWAVSIACNAEVNETDTLSRENLQEALDRKDCTVSYDEDDGRFPRRDHCITRRPTETCPETCMNEELVKKCESYFQTISVSESFVNYKNYYCGLCNEQNPIRLQCSAYKAHAGKAGSGPLKPFSLQLLFDFDPSKGLRIGRQDPRKPCPKGHVLVGAEGSCQLVACPEGQRLLKGSCLPNEANATMVITLIFNETRDAEKVISFLEGSTGSGEFLTGLQKELQMVLDDPPLDKGLTGLDVTTSEDGPQRLNITLFFQFHISPNSSFDQRTELNIYKEDFIYHVNAYILNLLMKLKVDIGSVEVIVSGMLIFQQLPVRRCTWVIYNQSNYDITDNTLRLRNTGQEYDAQDFRPLGGGSTIVCVTVSHHTTSGINLDVSPALGILTLVCIILSILCLFVRIILQCVLPYYRSFAGHMQFNLCLSLCLAFILLLVGGTLASFPTQKVACRVVGALMYCAFLSAFFWMVAMAFDSFLVFRPSARFERPGSHGQSLLKYVLAAWGLPAVITGIVVGIDFSYIDSRFRPHFGENICWFNERYALLLYFGIPVALTTLSTLILFIAIVIYLGRTLKDTAKVSNRQESHRLTIYTRLFALMGVCWIIGFVAAFVGHIALWIIFILLNASQGVFIFFSFVTRRAVFKEIRSRIEKLTSQTASTWLNTSSEMQTLGVK